MIDIITTELIHILPELIIACGAIIVILAGALGNLSTNTVSNLSLLFVLLAVIAILFNILNVYPDGNLVLNSEMLFGQFLSFNLVVLSVQLVLLLSVAAVIIFSRSLTNGNNSGSWQLPWEFSLLLLLALLGMMLMIKSDELIIMYISLELMSLSLYVTASIKRDNALSVEAGAKYFLLGSLASCVLLYGISLIYGATGTTNLLEISNMIASGVELHSMLSIGVTLVFVAFCFKIAAAPFHMWSPDVYQGVPTIVTLFFLTAPKFTAIFFLFHLVLNIFGDMQNVWLQILTVASAISMIFSAFAAIRQRNIKRMLAYSSVGHVGYMLMALASGAQAAMSAMLIYMAIYVVMNIGLLGILLYLKYNDKPLENIDNLKGLSVIHPKAAFAMAVFMFSMAGIPPLAGFFAKLQLFVVALDAGLIGLVIIGLIASVVSCFYYLRIVKYMYIDEMQEEAQGKAISNKLDLNLSRSAVIITTGATFATLLFVFFPYWVNKFVNDIVMLSI